MLCDISVGMWMSMLENKFMDWFAKVQHMDNYLVPMVRTFNGITVSDPWT